MSNIVYGELEPGAASRGTAVWLRLQTGSSIPMGMYWYVIEAKVWLPIPPASRCLGDVELFIRIRRESSTWMRQSLQQAGKGVSGSVPKLVGR